eukprot:gene1309-2526_t
MLLKEKDTEGGGEDDYDVHKAIYHLCIASSLGHMRAMDHLAHGLFDPESWLGAYSRKLKAFPAGLSHIIDNIIEEHEDEKLIKEFNATLSSKGRKSKSKSSGPLITTVVYKFNRSEPLRIFLPYGTVELPHPPSPSCRAALPLLEYLATTIYHTNDLTDDALSAYIDGSLWEALEYYDEAADLGIPFAQENAAFLYEELEQIECGVRERDGGSGLDRFLNATAGITSRVKGNNSDNNNSNDNDSSLSNAKDINSNYMSPLYNLSSEECSKYMQRMAGHRWLQLGRRGVVDAVREVADRIQSGREPFDVNVTNAVELYTLGAEAGDVQSLMNLGWIFYTGKSEVHKNISLASRMFSTAFQWEVNSNITYPYSRSTHGLAPALAWSLVQLVQLLHVSATIAEG